MSWWSAVPEVVLGVVWLFAPGTALILALGARRHVPVLAAPAVSVGLLGGLAVVFAFAGLPWTAPVVGVAVVLVAAVALGIRRILRAREGARVTEPSSAPERGSLERRSVGTPLILAGVVVGGLLAAVPMARGMGPDTMLQSWDNVFQLSATRFVIDTANASPFHIQEVSHQVSQGTAPFYPAAWHGVAALATVGSVIRSTNALILVVAGAVWPAGIAALARVTVPGRPMVAMVAPVVGGGFFAFPAFLLGWGWPNALAIALIPGVLALTMVAVGRGNTMPSARLVAAGLAVIGLGGVGLAHPNGALTFGVVASPLIVRAAVRAAGATVRHGRARWRAWPGAGLLLVAGAIWCVAWFAAVVLAGRHIADTSQQGTSGLRHGVWMALTGATNDRTAQVVLASLLALGAVVVLARRRGGWLIVSLAVIVMLAGIAEDDSRVKWITQAWFMDPSRFRAPAVIFTTLIVAIGLVWLAGLVSRGAQALVHRGRARRRRPEASAMTALSSGVVVLILVVATGGLWAGERRDFIWGIASGAAQPESEFNLVSTAEMEMIKRLDTELTPGRRVLGTPLNGSTLPYVVGNIPVVFTNFSGRWPDDANFLTQHFSEIHENPEVCAAIERLNIGYYYADSTVFHPAHPFHAAYAGLPPDPPQPGFELVDSGAGARVYRITACD